MFKIIKSCDKEFKIEVSNEVIHHMSEGLGFNWYSCYESNTYPAPDDEIRWKKIFDHVEWLNMQFFRFGQNSDLISDENGCFKPGHSSFSQLKRLNAWAERKGVSILIDSWSIPKAFQFEPWEGAPHVHNNHQNGYSLGVKDINGYVNKFIIPYVKYVTEEMNCKAVVWFNHVNEPLCGTFTGTPPGVDKYARYVEVLKAIRQGLDKAGLSKIGNMGPDTFSHKSEYWPIPHMLEVNADPDPFIEAYCMHQYQSHFDWDCPSGYADDISIEPLSRTIETQVAKYSDYAHAHKKPYFITELGMFQFGNSNGDPAGVARHDTALLEAEFIIRSLNKKVDGILRWAWLNPGIHDGWWQLINTTDGSDSPMMNTYYSYGTLMRYIDKGAGIFKSEVSHSSDIMGTVHAAAVINPDGSKSLYVINDAYADCAKVTISFKELNAPVVKKIVNDAVRKHFDCGEINIIGSDMEYEDVLSPMSLTVYTTRI